MPIAPKIKSLTLQLDTARQQYRLGRLELASLQLLDHQVTALLDEARNTHFESGVLCLHAVVRSLETLALQKARLGEPMSPQTEPHFSRALAVA